MCDQISADPVAGLAYLPVETPTIDYYGGNRPGNNLFAESIVAVDLKTGVRKWHLQEVHHGLWDDDNSSASLLIDTTINGQPRKLLAQPTKQGWLFVFDRTTGQPIWPIRETPVPQTNVPTEKAAPTQPIPSNPPPYSRTFLAEGDLIDFTPALRAQALKNLQRFRWEPSPYVPPIGPDDPRLGSINMANASGGVNWPGSGFDPETGIFYTQANNSAVELVKFSIDEFNQIRADQFDGQRPRKPRWEADPNYGRSGTNQPGAAVTPPSSGGTEQEGLSGERALGEGLEGLPIVKPPYGVIAAIDLSAGGKLLFQVPHGDTPDSIRNNPLLRGIDIPKTGQSESVGVLVTKTFVAAREPFPTTTPPGRSRGAMLRAYDKKTGVQTGEVLMPAPISGSPMTYMVDGRAMPRRTGAVGGGNYTSEYIAYALPPSAQAQ